MTKHNAKYKGQGNNLLNIFHPRALYTELRFFTCLYILPKLTVQSMNFRRELIYYISRICMI